VPTLPTLTGPGFFNVESRRYIAHSSFDRSRERAAAIRETENAEMDDRSNYPLNFNVGNVGNFGNVGNVYS
jgi:hypothetical protein